MKVLLLLGFIFLTMAVHGKKMERCEFFKTMNQLRVDALHDAVLASWACLAETLSNLNTTAIHYNPDDKSTNYGIFQINSHFWCDDGKTPNTLNRCGVNCSELLGDNFVKAVNCVKKIVAEEGIKRWPGWVKNCATMDVPKYLEGCHL